MIFKKCYVENLKLKKIITVDVNAVGIKVKVKPPKEALIKECLIIPGEGNTKAVEEDLISRDDF